MQHPACGIKMIPQARQKYCPAYKLTRKLDVRLHPHYVKPNHHFQTLLILFISRLKEMDAYYLASENVKQFTLMFDQQHQKNTGLEAMMSQFSTEQSRINLSSVCEIRNDPSSRIVLKLKQVSMS